MDRTLVRKNTASLYMKYQVDHGEADWRDRLRLAWWLLQYKFGVIDARSVAEFVLKDYRGRAETDISSISSRWFEKYVAEHVCEDGRRAVQWHQEQGDVVVMVTGATWYAAEPVAHALGIEHVACTRLQVEDGRFTGEIDELCYGRAKIDLAGKIAAEQGFELADSTFYSDSITDMPLFEVVKNRVAVNPDLRLRRVAERRGWRVERW